MDWLEKRLGRDALRSPNSIYLKQADDDCGQYLSRLPELHAVGLTDSQQKLTAGGLAFLAARWHWPGILCIPIGLATGIALGCINATLIYFVRVTSIIATIATMSVFFALLMYTTEGKFIVDLPDLGGAKKIEKLGVPVRTLVTFEGH